MDKSLWKDYFDNLGKALSRLNEALEHPELGSTEIIQDAAIHRFEFCIELYWKVLKKILFYEKIESTTPRDVLRKAYQFKLINDEEQWLSMLDDRNNTSPIYKQEDAKRVFDNIKERFRNNFPFCLENFEPGASNFENRPASLAFLSADRKRKNYAADVSKYDDKMGSYFENVPKLHFPVMEKTYTTLKETYG